MNGRRYVNYTLGGSEWIPRFINALDQRLCTQCCSCVQVCPAGVFARTVKGTVEPVNRKNCIGCAVCERMCAYKAIKCLPLPLES
ncbi:MAG: hypothetical protein EOM80_08310 [Erysipelotrichia bacterium]|nr:hypothetical protein [Erysipelotrichia bacterium]